MAVCSKCGGSGHRLFSPEVVKRHKNDKEVKGETKSFSTSSFGKRLKRCAECSGSGTREHTRKNSKRNVHQ
jgi:hypothetical protein